jgi:VIT1/CCC1 family predicted Fe2+/Mn2+ transporter
MKRSLKIGISFGLTSGVITTLGLMVGLHSGTHSRLVVLGGILTIAIAHISEESKNAHTHKHVWAATVSTFLSKLLFALTFVIPVLLFELSTAILVSVAWGLSMLALLSYYIAKSQGRRPWGVVAEHLLIALAVITATHLVGDWIAVACG